MKDSLLGFYCKEKRKTILHKKVGVCPRTRHWEPLSVRSPGCMAFFGSVWGAEVEKLLGELSPM
jgi:hypothetical protein